MGVICVELSDHIEQLGPWVAPGVIAIFGVWLGKVWERRSNDRHWWREQRAQAYIEFAAVVEHITDRAAWASAVHDPDSRLHAVTEMTSHYLPLTRACQRVSLLGPPDVASVASDSVRAVLDWSGRVQDACAAAPDGKSVDLPDSPSHLTEVERFMREARTALNSRRHTT